MAKKSNSFNILWLSLLTARRDEDPFKNEDAKLFKTDLPFYQDTQGQLTPQSEVGSAWNSNSFNHLLGFFQTLNGLYFRSSRSNLPKFRNHPRLYGCPSYLKE